MVFGLIYLFLTSATSASNSWKSSLPVWFRATLPNVLLWNRSSLALMRYVGDLVVGNCGQELSEEKIAIFWAFFAGWYIGIDAQLPRCKFCIYLAYPGAKSLHMKPVFHGHF